MICRSCLRLKAPLRPSSLSRPFTTSRPYLTPEAPPTATSTSAAQPFGTPLSPTPNPVSLGTSLKPKSGTQAPQTSICAAGTQMKGINYLKNKADPVALAEDEYPEWLWRVLDVKEKDGAGEGSEEGDEFSKSAKLRRKAAKRQRKLEAKMLASGNTEAFTPKVPITQQSVELEGADERAELKRAMRRERRAGIKEKNYLKGM
ncbi:hypothetical protein LSUE1_G004929 [Lachnellula suecica]|uniref:Large ribosomal subunit protein mL54 n=1 Tax=Lachnellula suecica TaxID=602035 RepID=A0A8T9BY76_9HELO|nr:hypothetical protein LSUE1_G004929 [Lachnellula suecica]